MKSLYNKYSSKPIPVHASILDDDQSISAKGYKPSLIKVQYKVRDTYQLKSNVYKKTFSRKDDQFKAIDFPEEVSE